MSKLTLDRATLAALLTILLIALIVYAPFLFFGRTLLPADLLLITPPWSQYSTQLSPEFSHVMRRTWDPLFQFYPARRYLAESLQHGYIPLWNPHIFCGTPFAADGQSAVFYPINWFFVILPLPFAFGAVAFLHTLLTGVFFYAYGRRVGWSASGSTAGAVVWMLCGVQVGWQMWQVVDSTLCWLPLCLYFWEGLRSKVDSRQGVGLAASIALTLLAGHLQFAFYVLLTTFTYALYRPALSSLATYARSLFLFCKFAGLGAALAAVQIAATADLLHLSIRIAAPIDQLLPSALAPSQLALLVMPQLFGSEPDYLNHPFLTGQYYEKVIYCGVSALALALFALRLRTSQNLSRYWCGLCLFSLLMGVGTPLYDVFYFVVPLFKSFHGLSRAFVLFDFGTAALAATGITLLEVETPKQRNKAAKAAAAAILLFVVCAYRIGILENGKSVAYFLTHDWLVFGLQQLCYALLFAGAAAVMLLKLPSKLGWLACALVSLDMLAFAININTGSSGNLLYPSTPETNFVTMKLKSSPLDRVLCVSDGDPNHPQSRIIPNSVMSLGWNDISGSDPLILKRYDQFVDLVNSNDTGAAEPAGQGMVAQAGDAALDDLNVRWIVAPRVLSNAEYHLVYGGAVNIYENLGDKGPAWLVPLNRPMSVGTDAQTEESQLLSQRSLPKIAGDVETVMPTESSYRISASATAPSMLVISQTSCPGWTANVNGRPAHLFTVDGLLTGVELSPGVNRVELNYTPVPVRLGLYISLLGILFVSRWFIKLPDKLSI